MKPVETKIGNRLKSARKAQKITVKEMSKKTGLKKDYLEELENKKDIPTLGEIDKISKALGIRPGTLLDGEEDMGPVVSSIKKSRSNVSRDKEADRNYLHFYSLTKFKKNRQMDAYIVDIDPYEGRKTYSTHEGEEFIYVLEGSVEVIYGKKSYILKAGDTIYYDSIVPHFIGSASKKTGAKVLTLAYFPA